MRNGRYVSQIEFDSVKLVDFTHAHTHTHYLSPIIIYFIYIAPEWATECLIRALPSLTIQYIADSATIELSRDCGGTEGIKRLTCNGKQDQDMIQRELMCMSERETFTNDNQMKTIIDERQSQDDIDDIVHSDNTENNSIDKLANQIEASVDKIGSDRLDLDDIMFGDAPAIASQEADDEIKPIKSVKKIAMEKPMKNNPKQMRKLKAEQKEELMMSDQAVAVDEVAVTDEVLPHVKKAIEVTTPRSSVIEIQQTTTSVRSRRETEMPVKLNPSGPTTESNTVAKKSDSEMVHSKILYKDASFDHFLPPMLLVQHQNATAPQPQTDVDVASSTSESIGDGTQVTSSSSSTQVPTTNLNDLTTNSSVEISSSTPTTIASVSDSAPISTTSATTTTTVTTAAPVTTPISTIQKTNMMRPHAPKFHGEISYHAPATTHTTEKVSIDTATANGITETGNTTPIVSTTVFSAENATQNTNSNEAVSTTVKSTELTTETAKSANEPTPVQQDVPRLELAKRSSAATINIDKHQHKDMPPPKQLEQYKSTSHQQQPEDETHTKHADFTNSNLDYQQYKPNRKRILTKPETHTYIQKIFG